MKTKVVIDTNVLVSGIFFSGPPSRILKAWQDDRIRIAISEDIIEEYRRVIDTLSAKFESLDPDDDKFLACAITSNSKYIISGDKHLLKIGRYLNSQIVTPRHFLDHLLK